MADDASAKIAVANSCQISGNFDEAERLYLAVLNTEPEHPDALHFLGILRHQQGKLHEALALIGRALSRAPDYVDAHNNLGNIHKQCEHIEEAEACYRRALDIGFHADAMVNLAAILEVQNRVEESFEVHKLLVALKPDHPKVWLRLGQFLRRHATTEEHVVSSQRCFEKALEYEPGNTMVLSEIGVALYRLGRHAEAAEIYRAWLVREPDNAVAQHRLASCGGTAAPARASNSYVSKVFDDFSESFDEILLHKLDYRAPEILVAALSSRLPAPAAALDVLDAGCGTGLCGPLIKPWARQLIGVDLSAGMIDKARPRNVYDVLEVAELTAYLLSHRLHFDVVLSADTLVYFGALDEVIAAARKSLRPGGWLGFSLEALQDQNDEVRLNSSGRYSHSFAHVTRALEKAGFQNYRVAPEVLRKEAGNAVQGWVVTVQRSVLDTKN